MGFSQTRNSLKVSQPCGLKNDLLCSKPLRAFSHLENRELNHSCIAHCVRWVAWLYQKTSLVLSRWMRQARSTGLCVQIARSLHSSNRFRLARSTGLFETLSLESLTRFWDSVPGVSDSSHPFFGSLGSDFHRLCQRHTHITHNQRETTHRKPGPTPEDDRTCSGVAVRWRLCRCTSVAVTSLPCNEDFPHCQSITKLASSQGLWVGALVELVESDKPAARP